MPSLAVLSWAENHKSTGKKPLSSEEKSNTGCSSNTSVPAAADPISTGADVFLTAMGADETQIEASFCAAIHTAKQQKSISLEKRAEATYAEYLRQKASGSGGRGLRLALW
jgi:hypothetical protein